MAGKLVRKLMGRKPPLPPEVEQAHPALARLGQEKPVVAELADQVGACLSAA